MEKPIVIEKIQLIAVMRVLGCSQDAVRSILVIRPEKVVMTEKWLRNEDIDIVYDALEDQALRRTVVRELRRHKEVDDELMEKAVQVTRDDILRHYELTQKLKDIMACLSFGPPSVELFSDGLTVAKYASVEVNTDEIEAKDCWARVQIVPLGRSLPLHWGGMLYTSEETSAPRIDISHEQPARLLVAVAIPTSDRKAAALYPEARICGEVALLLESGGQIWNGEGCWLAQPLALDTPHPQLEAYLKPGKYRIQISLGCENGNGNSREFILHSPSSWEGLAISNA